MAEQTIKMEKQVPVVGTYDVVVCGGGPAGWVAAVAAARQGCNTALIERFGFFGGLGTAGLVVPISGFYHRGERVVGGIAWEFIEKMEADHAAIVELPKGHVSFDPEYYKLIAQRMVREAGVDIYTNSWLSGCGVKDGAIQYAVIENKNGTEAIAGKCFIDATGDADLARMAGAPMMEREADCQPMTMCFVLDGVDVTTDLLRDSIHHDGKGGKPSSNARIHQFLEDAAKTMEVPQFGGPWFNTLVNGDALAVNMTRTAAWATDNRAFMEAESRLREDMYRLVELLRGEFAEFKNCSITSSAVQTGVRESWHIKGEHTVTGEEMLEGVQFADIIAYSAHPMDVHDAKNSKQTLKQLPVPGPIPYRTMVTAEVKNMIAAGRCISADRMAHASLRVMATAMAIGEAAGVAAAISCKEDRAVTEVPAEELRGVLRSQGAVID